MKLFKKPYIYLIFVLFLVVFVTLFFIIKNPAAKTLDQFLSHINDSSKISLQNFVAAEILDDPFITTLMNQNIIEKYRIIKTQRMGKTMYESKLP